MNASNPPQWSPGWGQPPPALTRALRPQLAGRVLLGLALLGVASVGAAGLIPELLPRFGDQPSYETMALVGAVLILLTAAFLTYVGRVVGLGWAWVLFSVFYNGLILIVKFILSPYSLYKTTFTDHAIFEAGDMFTLVLVAGATLALYAGAFGLILLVQYAYATSVIRRGPGVAPASRRWLATPRLPILITAVGLLLIFLIPVGLMALIFGLQYVATILAIAGGPLAVLLALTLVFAFAALLMASDRSIRMGSLAVLASAAWIGLSLLLLYHAVWVVYTAVLVSIWPLKVVASSGK